MKLNYEQRAEQSMDDGDTVANDEITNDVTSFQEYREQLKKPIDVVDGLFRIDKNGDLYYERIKQDTDANHTVNRHVIKQMVKDIYEDVAWLINIQYG